MASVETPARRLDDLSDAEIARIEGAVFCSGGPPGALSRVLVSRAREQRPDPAPCDEAAPCDAAKG